MLLASAQAEYLNIVFNNGETQKINVSDIKEMTFIADEREPELLHSFDGYLIISSKYFTDSYYGDQAKLNVYKVGDTYRVTFSDPQWGEGVFDNVEVGRELKGEGKFTMTYQGNEGTYDASISGLMTAPVITLPDVMSGCTIKFMAGKAPEAYKYAGKYTGDNAVKVGEMATYTAEITYEIKANADGTVNLQLPAYQLPGTVMGDLSLGEYIISNIPYDEAKKAFYLSYGDTGIKQHLKAEQAGNVTLDSDYDLKSPSEVFIAKGEDGLLTVKNDFILGAMPFPLAASFTQKAGK